MSLHERESDVSGHPACADGTHSCQKKVLLGTESCSFSIWLDTGIPLGLLQILMPRTHFKPMKSECLRIGPGHQDFLKLHWPWLRTTRGDAWSCRGLGSGDLPSCPSKSRTHEGLWKSLECPPGLGASQAGSWLCHGCHAHPITFGLLLLPPSYHLGEVHPGVDTGGRRHSSKEGWWRFEVGTVLMHLRGLSAIPPSSFLGTGKGTNVSMPA